PAFEANQLVKNMASAVMNRYLVNSSIAWDGVASSWLLMAGRIGSTRPMPMKDTVAAKAIAHTDFGWRNASRSVGAAAGEPEAAVVRSGVEVSDGPTAPVGPDGVVERVRGEAIRGALRAGERCGGGAET